MENVIDCKNEVYLQGKIVSDPRFSHETFGKQFYTFDLKVPRLSGTCDILPIVAPKVMCAVYNLHEGGMIALKGQFRSFNRVDELGKSKLILSIFAKDLYDYQHGEDCNFISLGGYICKTPVFRTTPFGREITDAMIAVQRLNNHKSDYIPCIAWGSDARLLSKLVVSKFIELTGRIQSREYEKKYDDGTVETKRAYEVSVNNIVTIKDI